MGSSLNVTFPFSINQRESIDRYILYISFQIQIRFAPKPPLKIGGGTVDFHMNRKGVSFNQMNDALF